MNVPKIEKNTGRTETSSFKQKLVFWQFRLKLGRSRGVRGERTEHTQLFLRTFAGSGLTGPQKVHFSTFDGKL